MKVNLKIDVSSLAPQLFVIPPSQEALNKYAEEMEQWEKTDKSGTQPGAPVNGMVQPEEFAAKLILRAIKESIKEGNTGRLRHILRLSRDIENDYRSGVLNLSEDDVAFIRKCYGKMETWPAHPEDLAKFIILVEEALQPKGK